MAVYKFKKIVSESYPVLLTTIVIELAGGHVLESYSTQLTAIVLMMIPALNGTGGNIGSILGARLTSALHIGTVEPKLRRQEVLELNVRTSTIMGATALAFSGLFIFLRAQLLGITVLGSLKAALALFAAGLALIGIILFTVITAAFLSYTRGIDPDNIVIPIITSVVDVAGVITLLSMVQILGV